MSGTGACGSEACGCGAGAARSPSRGGHQIKFCPQCGSQGHPVSVRVLQNILKAELASRYSGEQPQLCLNPSCTLAYFDADEVFYHHDCASGIWFKEMAHNSYICYCEKITEREIIEAVVETGLDDLGSVMLYLRESIGEDCEQQQPAAISCNRYVQEAIEKGRVVREALLDYKGLQPDSKEVPYELIEQRYNQYLEARGATTMASAGCCGGGGGGGCGCK